MIFRAICRFSMLAMVTFRILLRPEDVLNGTKNGPPGERVVKKLCSPSFLPAEEEQSHRVTGSAMEEEVGRSAGPRASAGWDPARLPWGRAVGKGQLRQCAGRLWGEGGVDGQGGFFGKFSFVP